MKYNICCIKCHSEKELQMYAHRDDKHRLVGWVFVCENCKKPFASAEYEVRLSLVRK